MLGLVLAGSWAAGRPVQASTWQPIGPDGGQVLSLAVDAANPAVAYATISTGLYSTRDGGAHWRAVAAGTLAFPQKVVCDPAIPGTLYAAGAFLYGSTDGGETWTSLYPTTPEDGIVNDVAIDTSARGTLYVAKGTQVFKSVDSGTTWSESDAGLPSGANVLGVTSDPANPGFVYAATSMGVFRSIDGAATWSAARSGMGKGGVTGVVVDATQPGRLLALAGQSSPPAADQPGLLYSSADGGGHWSLLPVGGDGSSVVCVAVSSDGATYACTTTGLFRAARGASWTRVDRSGMPVTGALAVAPSSVNRLYAGALDPTYLGQPVYRTSSLGAIWQPAGHGLTLRSWSVAVDPREAGTLYVGIDNGLVKSTDDGATWTYSNQGIQGRPTFAIANSDSAAGPLYTDSIGLFRSQDAGATWKPVLRAFFLPVGEPVVHPRDGYLVYCVGNTGQATYLFKTENGGRSWTRLAAVTASTVPPLVVAPSSITTVYLDQSQGSSSMISISHNGGVSFSAPISVPEFIYSLVVDPLKDSTLYLMTGLGLEKSTDGGRTRAPLPPLPFDVTPDGSLLVDPKLPGTIYFVGVQEGQVAESRDGGDTWSMPVSGGLPLHISSEGLVWGPSNALYVLTNFVLYRAGV